MTRRAGLRAGAQGRRLRSGRREVHPPVASAPRPHRRRRGARATSRTRRSSPRARSTSTPTRPTGSRPAATSRRTTTSPASRGSCSRSTDDGYDLYGDGVIRMWQTPGHAPGHQSFEITLPNIGLDAPHRRRGLHDRPLGGEGAARLPRLGRRHGPLGAQAAPHRGALGLDRRDRPRPRRVAEASSRHPSSTIERPARPREPHRRSLDPHERGRSRRSGRRSSTGGSRRASATRWRSWPSASASPAPRCGRRCSCSSARASCASSATAASACSRRPRTTSRRSSRCACCSRSRPRAAPARCSTDDDLAALERELRAMARARRARPTRARSWPTTSASTRSSCAARATGG